MNRSDFPETWDDEGWEDVDYGPQATYKAEFLNRSVREHGIKTVTEFGCGDGNQLLLADYPEYVGVDVSPTAVDRCNQLFLEDDSRRLK